MTEQHTEDTPVTAAMFLEHFGTPPSVEGDNAFAALVEMHGNEIVWFPCYDDGTRDANGFASPRFTADIIQNWLTPFCDGQSDRLHADGEGVRYTVWAPVGTEGSRHTLIIDGNVEGDNGAHIYREDENGRFAVGAGLLPWRIAENPDPTLVAAYVEQPDPECDRWAWTLNASEPWQDAAERHGFVIDWGESIDPYPEEDDHEHPSVVARESVGGWVYRLVYRGHTVRAERIGADRAVDATASALRVALSYLPTGPGNPTAREAASVIEMILAQRGCEHFDPIVHDGRLTQLMDVVIFG